MKLLNLFAAGLALVTSTEAFASDYRHPGLGGSYASRNLTAPYNSLAVVVGPGQPQLLGQRFGDNISDGGVSFTRSGLSGNSAPDLTSVYHTRLGVVFGLTENLEAGALFLNLRIHEDFALTDFPVYVNYGYRFGNFDIGLRTSLITPSETKIWGIGVGAPIVLRLGKTRIDSGVHLPLLLDDPLSLGLNVPLRVTHNIVPRFFLGLETGASEPSFGRSNDFAVPLGGLAGYTTAWGSRVLDFTATMMWDNFLLTSPAAGIDQVQVGSYRVLAGVTIHKIVM